LKLTPLEIRNQEFRKALRGLDPVEVQTFLEMVSEQYEQLAEENKSLNRRIVELETRMQDYQANEKNLRETLINVQEVKKQSEESSRRQADFIVKEAELKALEILENARKQTRQIREEVSWLKAQKESFINRLRHILVSQIELLSVMEIDDVVPQEALDSLRNLKTRKLSQTRPAEIPEKEPPAIEEPAAPDAELEKAFESMESALPELENLEDAEDAETRIIQRMNSQETEEIPARPPQKNKSGEAITDEDINNFFKKGIQIDELIKTINKKGQDK